MSWRWHIAIVDTEKISKVRNSPKEHYLNEDGYTCDEDGENSTTEFYLFVDEQFGCKEDYCIGMLPNGDDYTIDSLGVPFYNKEDTQELFAHYIPRVLSKEDFQKILQVMQKEAYKLFSEIEANGIDDMKCFIHRRKELWASEYIEPYNIRDNSKEIVNAFSIDYQIFDVTRLYKTVDWEKDTVILFGW